MKLYKQIKQENGTVEIYGSNKWIKLECSDVPKFRYQSRTYRLDDFMVVPIDSFLEEFDGYLSDSLFSGIAIKLSGCGKAVKAYTYIS